MTATSADYLSGPAYRTCDFEDSEFALTVCALQSGILFDPLEDVGVGFTLPFG